MNLMNKPPMGQKPEPQKRDPRHIERVRSLPCVICFEFYEPQQSPTAAHHVIHGRGGNQKTPDSMAIPLCEGHHQGLWDTSKIALHREPDAWRAAYGKDTDWIGWVEARLGE